MTANTTDSMTPSIVPSIAVILMQMIYAAERKAAGADVPLEITEALADLDAETTTAVLELAVGWLRAAAARRAADVEYRRRGRHG